MNTPTIQQFIRALMVGALGAMGGVLGLLAVVDVMAAGGIGGDWMWRAWEMVPFVAIVAGAAGVALIMLVGRVVPNVPSPVVAFGLAVVTVIFVAASLDDAEFVRPLTTNEFSPFVPRGNESWELTVRDWPEAAQSAASASATAAYVRAPVTDPVKIAAEVAEKRDQIEVAWENIADVRAWLAQLNAFPEIGDSTPTRLDAPLLKFSIVRAVTQVTCARAMLLALDGRGDEAADTLLPLIEVARKLEPGARTLVRAMIARVMLGSGLDALGFVLAQTEVSPERRAALAAALERGMGGTAGARRLLTIEYVAQYDGYYRLGVPLGVTPPRGGVTPLQWLQRPFFLPKATANLLAAHLEELGRFADRREYSKLAACERQFIESLGGGQLNNPFGRLMLAMSIPASSKIVESYWKKEDSRLALIAELRKGR